MWSGPVAGWVAAIDRILGLDPDVIVPGHGPLASVEQVRALRAYLVLLDSLVRQRHGAGMDVDEAIRDIDDHIDHTPYAEWTDRERIVVNVQSIWRELEPAYVSPDVIAVFQAMADNHARRSER